MMLISTQVLSAEMSVFIVLSPKLYISRKNHDVTHYIADGIMRKMMILSINYAKQSERTAAARATAVLCRGIMDIK